MSKKVKPERFNIAQSNGATMLGDWVDEGTALKWLRYYMKRYVPGAPYPNGKGFYPDFGFRIVSRGVTDPASASAVPTSDPSDR